MVILRQAWKEMQRVRFCRNSEPNTRLFGWELNRVVCILSVSWCERVREQGRRTKHEQQQNHVWPSHSHKSNVLRLPQRNNCSYFCLENYDSNPELASDIRQLSCTCSAIENGARLQGVICRVWRLPLSTEKHNVQSWHCEG